MDDCVKGDVHVFRRSELLDGCESAVDLVAHNGNDVITRDHVLFVYKRLALKALAASSTQILAFTSFPLSKCLQISSFFFAIVFSFLLLWMLILLIDCLKRDDLKNFKWVSIRLGPIKFA